MKFIFKSLLLMIISAAIVCSVFMANIVKELPPLGELKSYNVNIPSIIYDRNNEVIAKLFTENRKIVELREISPWMIKTVLAAEDSDFYQHRGVSLTGIIRAFFSNVMQKIEGANNVQGGSTITQQLARNLYLPDWINEKNITRKIKEVLISLKLENIYSKDEILKMYMNTIYFGHGAWGVDTASRTYFGKPASELNAAESAMLAGLIPAPNIYNPMTNLLLSKTRQSYVLNRMRSLGWINESTARNAESEELVFDHMPNKIREYSRAPYFVSWILFSELLPKYGAEKVYGGGLEIYTTVDLRLQDKAQEIVANMANQGAIAAVVPGTCEVIVLVGGKDFNDSQFNRAAQAYRQPGSSFKPFVYGAAIETGLRPYDRFIDGRIKFGSGRNEWAPTNYDGKFHGEVTMLYALTKSLNTVPARCISHIGIEAVINFARNAGITTQHLPGEMSLALGSASLTPLEMAFAYSTFANSGKRTEKPIFIREVRSHNGDILEKNEPETMQAISTETSWTILTMLFDAITAGPGAMAKIPDVQVFGKTGTTNDFIDAWFIGGVPGLVASVYVGKDDNKTLGSGMTGGAVAAPPWKEFMTFAVSALGLESKFDVPSAEANVSLAGICRASGFLAASGCPAVPLYLKRGTAPVTKCPVHGGTGSYSDSKAPRLIRISQDGTALLSR